MLSTQKKKDSTPANRREFGQICTQNQMALTRHAEKSICPVSGTHLHTESTYTHQILCCRITTLAFTFLTNFKISNFNKEHMSSLKMI